MAINWIQNISSSGDLMFPLIDRNGMVLVYSSGVGAVVALEFRTGSIAWRLPLPPPKYQFVLNNEGNALIIHDSSTGDIRAFNTSSGAPLWVSNGKFSPSSDIFCASVGGKGVIFFIVDEKQLVGLDVTSGKVAMTYRAENGRLVNVVPFNDTILATTIVGQDHAIVIHALKASNLSVTGWRVDGATLRPPLRGELKGLPIFQEARKAIVFSSAEAIYSISTGSGELSWATASNSSQTFVSAAASEKVVYSKYCIQGEEFIFQIDAASGVTRGRTQVGACIVGRDHAKLLVDASGAMFTTSLARVGVARLLRLGDGRTQSSARAELQILLDSGNFDFAIAGPQYNHGCAAFISVPVLSNRMKVALVALVC
jgi:outer membrane protein assembly factor BamB